MKSAFHVFMTIPGAGSLSSGTNATSTEFTHHASVLCSYTPVSTGLQKLEGTGPSDLLIAPRSCRKAMKLSTFCFLSQPQLQEMPTYAVSTLGEKRGQ